MSETSVVLFGQIKVILTEFPSLHARYRAVPKKGAWKFGFRRGNKKHMSK